MTDPGENPLETRALNQRAQLNDRLRILNSDIRDFNRILNQSIPEAETFGNGDLDSVSLQETKNALNTASDRFNTSVGSLPSLYADGMVHRTELLQAIDIRLDDAFPETRKSTNDDSLRDITQSHRGHSKEDALYFNERNLDIEAGSRIYSMDTREEIAR
jgi:hypothetical protein